MATSKGLWSVAKWKPVRSAVLPRSVLGPVLVGIFVNDTDSGTGCTPGVFAGDTRPRVQVRGWGQGWHREGP